MNKLLLRAIVRMIQAAMASVDDYQYDYSQLPTATDKNLASLAAALKLLRQSVIHIDGLLDNS